MFLRFDKLLFTVFLSFAITSLSSTIPTQVGNVDLEKGFSSAVTSFIASESPIALAGVFNNIGPSGSKSQGAKSGIVIASPSTSNPNYLYTWTRDSALVLKQLVEAYILGNTSLGTTIQNYNTAQSVVQQISNPSGTFTTGGLGEPKFNIDETAFTGAWGRPQRDGPALRAITMILYSNAIYSSNPSYVTGILWPMIQADLNYVVTYWNQTGYDLWEEVSGSSFFTIANQHRALVQGYALSSKLGNANSAYSSNANSLLCFLQSFWSSSSKHIIANINQNNGRSGIDANSVLTSIHLFDPAAGCNALTFQPCSDIALANHKTYVDAFRSIYTINSGIASNAAVATGRYPEDSYYNGNPWYLATLACAEQLYDAMYVWSNTGTITVTSTSLAFFQQFSSSITTGSYASSSSTYSTIYSAVGNYADGFVAIVQQYIGSGGGLGEQFSKSNGTPTSAVDLSWSYSAFLTMTQARNFQAPPSWGATTATSISGCSPVAITFNELATTTWGENIYLVGSISQLASWDTDNALLLGTANYPTWSITVGLPPSTYIEYKFIRKETDGSIVWQDGDNYSLTTPASGSETINNSWV